MKKSIIYYVSIISLTVLFLLIAVVFLIEHFSDLPSITMERVIRLPIFTAFIIAVCCLYWMFLIIYIKNNYQVKSKAAIIIIHIGIGMFLLFSILHSVPNLYKESILRMEENKIYELEKEDYFVQWQKDFERLVIIKRNKEDYLIIAKLDLKNKNAKAWKYFQFQELDKEVQAKQLFVSVGTEVVLELEARINEVKILKGNERFELVNYFSSYKIINGEVVQHDNDKVNPGVIVKDKWSNEVVWINEDSVINLKDAKIGSVKTIESINILYINSKLKSLFYLSAIIFIVGYCLYLYKKMKGATQ